MAVPMVPSALVEYAPLPKSLPPGWVMMSWEISLDFGSYRRVIAVRASFLHLSQPELASAGARAEVEFQFPEGSPPDGYDWLCRFLIVAQDVPGDVRANVEGRSNW